MRCFFFLFLFPAGLAWCVRMTVPVLSTAIGERILQDTGSERVESSLIPADQLSEAKEKLYGSCTQQRRQALVGDELRSRAELNKDRTGHRTEQNGVGEKEEMLVVVFSLSSRDCIGAQYKSIQDQVAALQSVITRGKILVNGSVKRLATSGELVCGKGVERCIELVLVRVIHCPN